MDERFSVTLYRKVRSTHSVREHSRKTTISWRNVRRTEEKSHGSVSLKLPVVPQMSMSLAIYVINVRHVINFEKQSIPKSVRYGHLRRRTRSALFTVSVSKRRKKKSTVIHSRWATNDWCSYDWWFFTRWKKFEVYKRVNCFHARVVVKVNLRSSFGYRLL